MTVAHTAVEAAAIMGANRITMIGCEHHGPYAKRYGMGGYYQPDSAARYSVDHRPADGTRWLAELFEPYGIEVKRYFYNEGYVEIPNE